MELEINDDNLNYKKPLQSYYINSSKKEIYRLELDKYSNLESGNLLYENDRYYKYDIKGLIEGTVTVITPASETELKEYDVKNKKIINESYDDYLKNMETHAKMSDKKWIYNILYNKKDNDMIVYEDEHFIMLPDMKWTDDNIKNMYYLIIVKRTDLYSLRNLTGKEITLLEHINYNALKIIKNKHNIDENKIRSYIHYHPSIWHLHIHFNHIDCLYATTSIDFSHQLTDIIQNLKIDGEYYKKISLKIIL